MDTSGEHVADLQRRLDESLAQQAATADVLKVISRSTFDLQTVLETLIKSAVNLCGANRGSIFLREGDVFQLRAASSTTPEFLQYWAGHPPRAGRGSATSRVIASGKVEIIADVLADPEMAMSAGSLTNIRAALGVPMLRDNRVEGVMVLTRPEPGPFVQSQIDLVETFADQAVIAIENTRLFNESKEALERQTATADILKVIASSPSDVQPVFDAIAASANRLIGGFSATVMLFVGDALHLVALTPTNAAADQVLRASFPRPLAEFPPFELVRGGESVQFPDTEAENVPPVNRALARQRGYRSMVFAPLISNGAAVGILSVTRVRTGTYSTHQVQLLRTFADQAVIAIENTSLFEEVQAKTRDLGDSLQQQTATAEVLKVISRSAFDLQAVLDTLVTSAAQLCGADAGIIWLRKDNLFLAGAATGFSPLEMEFFRNNPRSIHDKSLAPRVLRSRQTEHIPDRSLDPEFSFPGMSGLPSSMLGVPLLRNEGVEGVFTLTRMTVAPFTARQIELVETFADQAVIAIENARLFDEVQSRTRELSQSLEDLRTAQDRLVQTEKLASLGQLTAGIAHEIKNPLNFVNNFSSLSAELTDELNDALKPVAMDGKVREEVDELTSLLKDNLEKVVQHGKRADSIVKNMLLHSREGSGEHRPADINSLLDESLNLAYHGARAEKGEFNITLQRDFDVDAGTIELFPQEITRAFLNLIANGVYAATKRRTEDNEPGFEPTLRASTKNLGTTVEIRIRDNGTGIPAEVQQKMFNPFFTTKPAGEGTGLGLSMTHDIIVKQHGGRIEVATEPGQFTEFTVVLPRQSNLVRRGET